MVVEGQVVAHVFLNKTTHLPNSLSQQRKHVSLQNGPTSVPVSQDAFATWRKRRKRTAWFHFFCCAHARASSGVFKGPVWRFRQVFPWRAGRENDCTSVSQDLAQIDVRFKKTGTHVAVAQNEEQLGLRLQLQLVRRILDDRFVFGLQHSSSKNLTPSRTEIRDEFQPHFRHLTRTGEAETAPESLLLAHECSHLLCAPGNMFRNPSRNFQNVSKNREDARRSRDKVKTDQSAAHGVMIWQVFPVAMATLRCCCAALV